MNGKSGYALDGAMVYYVDVHEKNGDNTGVRLGFSAEGNDYIYNSELSLYQEIEE